MQVNKNKCLHTFHLHFRTIITQQWSNDACKSLTMIFFFLVAAECIPLHHLLSVHVCVCVCVCVHVCECVAMSHTEWHIARLLRYSELCCAVYLKLKCKVLQRKGKKKKLPWQQNTEPGLGSQREWVRNRFKWMHTEFLFISLLQSEAFVHNLL